MSFFSGDYREPVAKLGGTFATVFRARIYRDGDVVIQHVWGGSILEFNIHDVTAITLTSGGWGKSRVVISGKGVTLGESNPIPVSKARDLKIWLEIQRKNFQED